MFSLTSCIRFSLITGLASLLSLASLVGSASSSVARESGGACGITNGGFEIGDFTGWETIGRTNIKTTKYGSGPTEGSKQALLDTFSEQTVDVVELARFLNIAVGDLNNLGEVFEGSAIKTTFSANVGDILMFDWNFLTKDFQREINNDFAFFTLSPIGTNKLANTYSIFPMSLRDLTEFEYQTGFQTYSYTITTAGTYTLGFGVVDVGDGFGESGLLIDNVSLSNSSRRP
jgi:hypothetical protein